MAEGNSEELVTHRGGCHCGSVAFEVDAAPGIVAWDCNCSICLMCRNTHFIVPASRFRLLKGEDALTDYRFNTKQARHLFCRVCGVKSFYIPRSNPDGVAVTVHCIDRSTVRSVEIRPFDGKEWEAYIAKSGIQAFSKEGNDT